VRRKTISHDLNRPDTHRSNDQYSPFLKAPGLDIELLSGFLIKVVATGSVLVLASLAAERAGVLIAGLIITLPLNVGPGFFFVAQEVDADFLKQSALMSFTATAAVHTYTTAYAHASTRLKGFWSTWLAAVCVWGVVAYPLVTSKPGFVTASIIVALGFVLANLLRYRGHDQKGSGDKAKRRGGIGFLLVRAVIGGSAVATAATFAQSLGPALTGLAFAFPVMMSANAWMLYTSYSPAFSAATISNARNGLLSYASFCYAMAILPGYVPNMTAWSLAVVISILASVLLVGIRRWRRG